ncbi:MAG: type II secretion system protein [Xanthomonadales bacterium]|nr:type II secretion system GspH family protein [Gammaproteobacteria bacterium]MBT8063486.1 type II secretion system GspH family protein [Gammaproteobacteria bacterium]NNK34119.1 type II secretion system protein [Xanthomonadales bacterium]NNK38474.1 type II secretion system protein [Xanthomonadales bacterium]
MNSGRRAQRGISFIEVLIAFAVTCIFLAATLPAHRDSLIRDRVGASIQGAEAARKALLKACIQDDQAVVTSNRDAGYAHQPPHDSDDHISQIELSANCADNTLLVMIWTARTGARVSPVIALSADGTGHGESWRCLLVEGDLRHVPSSCRMPVVES